jgi:hypothetical protein
MTVLSVISSHSASAGRPLSPERGGHGGDQVGVGELARGEVDRHLQAGALRRRPPRGRLPAGLPQHPRPERHDQAGLLGHRDELRRRQRARGRVLPADQRLEAGDDQAGRVRDRLVHHAELVIVEGPEDLFLDHHVTLQLEPEPLVEDLHPPAAALLGVVHGDVGVAEELVG